MDEVQTAFDLRAAGEQEPVPTDTCWPYKRTPMDDTYVAARLRRQSDAERQQYRALRELEARHGA